MNDKRLEEIRARHSLFESNRILYEEKNRHRLVSDSAVLHADIGALLDLVDALQARLGACAEREAMWRDRSDGETFTQQTLLFCADELRKVLNG